MTRQEAITTLRNAAWLGSDADREKTEQAVAMAVSALKKLIPERPMRITTNEEVACNFQGVCPSCGWLMFKRERVTTKDKSEPVMYRICNFCQSCGQRIDWGKS